ncbi:hypothetical protein AO382_0137 [Moraxella catarrhalis]|uniref:Uncharacterized protein n=1 Tax=Moraxella catarrhalis TaxID=480 RepID=A0A7Z1A4I8_MORCA|nr:hypothetical protein AO382_0137 [Moraxella catarrhalis]
MLPYFKNFFCTKADKTLKNLQMFQLKIEKFSTCNNCH